jgi:hypothetical protein
VIASRREPRPSPDPFPGHDLREHFSDARRERLFLSSVAFLLTFVIVRGITYAIHAQVSPLHDVVVHGTHIHHLVWGILLLLAVGYLWLAQVGTGVGRSLDWPSRLTALMYGAGAALTLDEFALWLRLEDVYWAREGRESIDAVILFGALLSVGTWGGRFFNALVREAARAMRR